MPIVTRNCNGSLTVSDIIDGFRVARTYYGFTRRAAVRMFRAETRATNRKGAR